MSWNIEILSQTFQYKKIRELNTWFWVEKGFHNDRELLLNADNMPKLVEKFSVV